MFNNKNYQNPRLSSLKTTAKVSHKDDAWPCTPLSYSLHHAGPWLPPIPVLITWAEMKKVAGVCVEQGEGVGSQPTAVSTKPPGFRKGKFDLGQMSRHFFEICVMISAHCQHRASSGFHKYCIGLPHRHLGQLNTTVTPRHTPTLAPHRNCNLLLSCHEKPIGDISITMFL